MIISRGSERVSKEDTYLNCAEVFAYRSTCLKRKYGAVIVKNDAVLSTGYNGSPRGTENCCDRGECPRIPLGLHQGEGYGMCRAVHAEANALLNCSREQTVGADLYLTGREPLRRQRTQSKALPPVRKDDNTGRDKECLPPPERYSQRLYKNARRPA